mmetsp:Transcript_73412/g.139547  ORF Transcript_73412/g.139547 Transcript_73412/m.139547 type:complete len:212 (-) Transcript_73412:7-642(-)
MGFLLSQRHAGTGRRVEEDTDGHSRCPEPCGAPLELDHSATAVKIQERAAWAFSLPSRQALLCAAHGHPAAQSSRAPAPGCSFRAAAASQLGAVTPHGYGRQERSTQQRSTQQHSVSHELTRAGSHWEVRRRSRGWHAGCGALRCRRGGSCSCSSSCLRHVLARARPQAVKLRWPSRHPKRRRWRHFSSGSGAIRAAALRHLSARELLVLS